MSLFICLIALLNLPLYNKITLYFVLCTSPKYNKQSLVTSIINYTVRIEQGEAIFARPFSVPCMLRAGVLMEQVEYREKYVGGLKVFF